MKQKAAALAKVTRPLVAGVFPRKRLFEALDHMREKPIIWVSGPAGCGKTILAVSYIQARELPCLWYEIDEGDADPATFFYYMGLATKKAAPRRRKPLPLLTPEYLPGISTFTLRYFEELYDRLKVPCVLVLDNYQDVEAESPVHEIIRNGLSRIPNGINVILMSRSEPPPVFARMRAGHLMEVIGWKQLRLRLEESRGIVKLRTTKRLSEKLMRHLHSSSDGWAAGLVLMLETAKREGIDPQEFGKRTPEEIFDYFGNEVFDDQTSRAKEFLLKTAFLPKMSEKMAEELTGLGFSNRILTNLTRNNNFTIRRFHTEPVYQYHPLFREFLLSRARQTLSEDMLSALCTRAAKLLEDVGEPEAALSLLHEVCAWNAMVALIMKNAPIMLAQGRGRPLEEWLGCLPKDLVETSPWLLYWMGACRMPFDPASSRHYFEQAFERLDAQEDVAGMFLAWSGTVDAIVYGNEDFAALDHWISVLEELMEDGKTFPTKEIEVRVAASMCAALVYRQPHHPDLEAWGERVLSSAQDPTIIGAKMQTLYFLTSHALWSGDFERVLFLVKSLQGLARSRYAGPLGQIVAKLGEVGYTAFMALHEDSCKAVSAALEISRRSGVHIMDPVLLGNLISSTLNTGDCATARKLLDKMAVALGDPKPWDRAHFDYLKTRMALIEGVPEQALPYAESCLKLALDAGAPANISLAHLQKARVMHAVGRHEEATRHLEQSLNIAREIKSKPLEFWVLLLEAQIALDLDDEATGLMSLRKGLAIGKDEEYLHTFVDQPSATARVCAKALEAGIEVSYVQNIIKKRNLIPDDPPVHLENWPWAFKVFTLGRFSLLRDEKPVQFSKKAQKRPLSMLKALIAFGGRQVSKDQIADALWPDADGDLAHQAWSTTLHRFRQLLGHEEAVQRSEGQLTLDQRYWWVDVWAFERLLGQADVHWEEGTADSAVHLMKKAIDMYKGPFLAQEPEQPWMIPVRERVRSKLLRNVGKLGNHWQQAGQWDKALECYKKCLEVDSLAEELYQCLMTCYQSLGRKADAIATYRTCQKTLSSILGVEPSPKTEAMYKALLSK